MRRSLFVLINASLVFLVLCGAALADGIVIPIDRPGVPPRPIRSLAIKYHRVTVKIDNQVAITHVDQVFVNDNPFDMEGEYIFPLPEGASISQFAMWVDGRRLEAEVLERDKARQIYEDIVRQKRDPALLEYVGRNAFRARVYPIPARSEKRIELEYSEVLPQDHGLIRYVYPLNTEKFSSRPLEEVSVNVQIVSRQAIKAVYSPSHEVSVRKVGDQRAEVSYRAINIRPDKDFVLYYTVSGDDLGANLLSYREGNENGFFMLLLAPRSDVQAEALVAQDVLFVLDTSGSMRGSKLEQAKRAAKYVLEHLNPRDRFNIISFNTSTSHYAGGLRSSSEAGQARAFVDALQATGSTHIVRALEEALAQTASDRPQIVLFLTDGLPTEGETRTEKILERVSKVVKPNVRIFCFGVGYDVNTVLLDMLAQSNRGATVYVRPEEDIEGAVSSLFEKISKPVLSDVTLDFGSVRVEDVYPYPLPDLFAGGQLVVVGRYRNSGDTTITLRGTVNGRATSYTFKEMRFRQSGGADFVPRLWATRRIGHLLTQIRLHGADKELVEEIVRLSVRYGIVTPYTSFLINEDEDVLQPKAMEKVVEREIGRAPAPALPAQGMGGGGAMPTPAVSGQKVVERSIAQESLRKADVAVQPETEKVRIVGSKTFVLRNGIWVDTTYDAQKLTLENVAFGSERYAQLLREHPDWGRYLALGVQVILVYEGRAYQFISDMAQATPTLPTAQPQHANPTPTPQSHIAPRQPTPHATATRSPSFWQQLASWFKGILKQAG